MKTKTYRQPKRQEWLAAVTFAGLAIVALTFMAAFTAAPFVAVDTGQQIVNNAWAQDANIGTSENIANSVTIVAPPETAYIAVNAAPNNSRPVEQNRSTIAPMNSIPDQTLTRTSTAPGLMANNAALNEANTSPQATVANNVNTSARTGPNAGGGTFDVGAGGTTPALGLG